MLKCNQEVVNYEKKKFISLWTAWTESKGGMWGIYIAKDRNEIKEKDPMGYQVITSFLPENINKLFRVDPSFEGKFVMSLDKNIPYTFKSQYLKDLALTGNKNSSIVGNAYDNIFMGNSGDNFFDGNLGFDVVQFKGKSSEYKISYLKDKIIVEDKIRERDGKDTLKNIELLRFTDKDIKVK